MKTQNEDEVTLSGFLTLALHGYVANSLS